MSPRGRSILFLCLSLASALLFLRLGVWQLSRLQQRRARNAPVAAARAMPVVSLDDPVQAREAQRDGIDNRRVRITGRYDHAAEIVIRGQSQEGEPGVRIVTPLRPLGADSAVLVQRGFVPTPDAISVRGIALEEPGVREVTGLALVQPDSGVPGEPSELNGALTWRALDLRAVRERLPYPVQGFLIVQFPDTGLPRLPRRDPLPALSEGPHLGYAIQWFAGAVIALVVGGMVILRRPFEPSLPPNRQEGPRRRR